VYGKTAFLLYVSMLLPGFVKPGRENVAEHPLSAKRDQEDIELS